MIQKCQFWVDTAGTRQEAARAAAGAPRLRRKGTPSLAQSKHAWSCRTCVCCAPMSHLESPSGCVRAKCARDPRTGRRQVARDTEMLMIVLDVKGRSLPSLRHCRPNGCISHCRFRFRYVVCEFACGVRMLWSSHCQAVFWVHTSVH